MEDHPDFGRRGTCKALAASLLVGSGYAVAQTRPYSVVVPFPPGASTDTMGRVLSGAMAQAIGETVVTENRPGANATIGASFVAAAPADGRTLLFTPLPHLLAQQFLMKDLKLRPLSDLAPVMRTSVIHSALWTSAESPIRSAQELIDSARNAPGKLTYGFYGELGVVLLAATAGIKLLAVPYKGGAPALIDVAAGRVDVSYNSLATGLPMLRAGKLRLLAVYSDQRLPELPDVPTMKEVLPSYEGNEYQGVFAPAFTPRPVIEVLYRKVAAALDTPEIRRQFQNQGATVSLTGPDEFRTLLQADQARIRAALAAAGVAPT